MSAQHVSFDIRGSRCLNNLRIFTDQSSCFAEEVGSDMPKQTIVIVDDEPSMRAYLSEVLAEKGFCCECFEDGMQALTFLSQQSKATDLVLADIKMPGMGGLDMLRTSTTFYPDLPVVMISGMCDLALALEALRGGATDYLIKPATPADVIGVVRKSLGDRGESSHAQIRQALGRFLSASNSGDNTFDQLRELFEVLGLKRYETLQHSRRVAAYAKLLGRACRFSRSELTSLQLGAMLHDIGKVAIPRNILLKPGPLTPEEMTVMRLHPVVGWELLSEFGDLEAEAELVYSHHEKFDGTGYPRGLEGKRITPIARAFSIVDTLDAISSDRPYRHASSIEQAREIIVLQAGAQFDPELVGVFADVPVAALRHIKQQFPEGDVKEASQAYIVATD